MKQKYRKLHIVLYKTYYKNPLEQITQTLINHHRKVILDIFSGNFQN